ncbi:MAG: hypothetical protein Q9185_006693 [Variospora sp. 1 TL-2023]
MTSSSGPPVGTLKYMTPYPIADQPSTPKSISDVVYPDRRPAERAVKRFSLAGRSAIVTGGAQGLGIVCVRALLEHGVGRLAIFDVDTARGEEALDHIRHLHNDDPHRPEVVYRTVDVSDEAAVNANVEAVAESFNGIDILVSFAGITGSELSVDYDIDRWKKIFDVNLHGSFLVARAVAR